MLWFNLIESRTYFSDIKKQEYTNSNDCHFVYFILSFDTDPTVGHTFCLCYSQFDTDPTVRHTFCLCYYQF
jgi:hypothetical protein